MKKIIILSLLSFLTKLGASHPLAYDSNAFAISFYEQAENSDNRCFSPYSIFRALSSTYIGSGGKTKEQMEKTLHLSCYAEQLPFFVNALQKTLEQAGVKTTDTLWLKKETLLLPAYAAALEEMGNTVETIDFSRKKSAVKQINTWIADQTNGNIQNLLSEGDITPATEMLLTNTVFFEGIWAFPFSAEFTKNATFYGKKDSFEVSMMHQVHHFPYHEDALCQAVLLPIANSSCSCFFILPKQSMEELESSIQNLPIWIEHTHRELINLALPKFDVRQTLKLKDVLSKMGMQDPFSPNADFSYILKGKNLHMEQVIHEAFFSIQEKGVKAGAATAITMAKSCAVMKKDPISFIANRPFLFGIVDENSKVVLFLGKLSVP